MPFYITLNKNKSQWLTRDLLTVLISVDDGSPVRDVSAEPVSLLIVDCLRYDSIDMSQEYLLQKKNKQSLRV